eukprot:7863424-Pyramimonas_sp.AAC.1
MAAFPVRVLAVGSRVDDEVISRPSPTRVEVVAHEQALSSSLVELRRGLVEVRVGTFPEDTSTK